MKTTEHKPDERDVLLAILAANAPSYDRTLDYFARAHQRTCQYLAETGNKMTPNEIREAAAALPPVPGEADGR